MPEQYHRSFKEHVIWLNSRDLSEAESYWRQNLKGFTSPTILAVDQNPDPLSNQESVSINVRLGFHLTTLPR